MASSFVRTVASGSTDTFTAPAGYLAQDHVFIYKDDVELTVTVDYTWPTSNTIQLVAGNPTAGAIILAKRVTPVEPLVDFEPGNLSSDDLDVLAIQAMYLAQENREQGSDIAGRAWLTSLLGAGGTITKGTAGAVPKFDASGNLVPGVTVTEIAEAQGYAETASASAGTSTTQAALSARWAEGTEPGGGGTKSAKEHSEDAQAATEFTYVVAGGTIDAGAGPYDMVGTIGAEANLELMIGGQLQEVGTYTISGTTFTLLSADGLTGLPWQGKIRANVRSINAPADGSVLESSLGTALSVKLNSLVFASGYASNQAAADAAIASGIPLFVPQSGGIVVRVPEDIANLQDAINTVASWVFPSGVAADQDFPYASPELVTISLEGAVLNTVGKGFVWPLAKGVAGDKTVLAGRGKTSFNITSLQSQTGASGLIFLTCNVSAIPAGLIAGSYIGILLTSGGAGEHFVVRGCWQVSSIDVPNTRITFKVKDRTELSIPSLALSSASCFFWPTGLQFQGMPYDGNDRGGIEVPENCQLRIKDIVLIGDPNGGAANSASTNGIVARKAAAVDFGQHMGLHGWPRKGVWFVEAGEGLLSYAMISACDQGFKGDTGSRIVFDYGVSNGNVANNVVSGLGTVVSGAPMTACGCTGASLLSVDQGDIITSLAVYGRVSNSGYGTLTQTEGTIHLNDMPVVGCTVGASARPASSIFTNGVFTANGTDYKPAINTATMGAIVSNNFASDL